MEGIAMDTANLKYIAEEVLDDEGQFAIGELIHDGKIEEAEEYLLLGVDRYYDQGSMSFAAAARLYSILGFPPERACEFRQKNLGVFYS